MCKAQEDFSFYEANAATFANSTNNFTKVHDIPESSLEL